MGNLIISQLLAILIIVGGISFMFGGKSLATKMVTWPFRKALKLIERLLNWALNQIKRAVKSLLRETWKLGVKAVRAAFRGLWRIAKRIVP